MSRHPGAYGEQARGPEAGGPEAGIAERRDWRRAGRSLRRLIEDPTRTEDVFEIIDALSGPEKAGLQARFVGDPAGGRLLEERPDLLARLSDREALGRLPEGTLGRAYADFMERGGITADGLVAADVERPGRDADGEEPGWLYVGERQRDAHDLWHVVTGYGMDEAGEAALLAFSYAQFGALGMALIAAAAGVIGPKDLRLSWQRYLLRAWRRGRRARWLLPVPWEDWLVRPLLCVRRDLRIEPPEVAHPGGVVVAPPGGVMGVGRAVPAASQGGA